MIRRMLPGNIKHRLLQMWRPIAMPTAALRLMPNFILIGGQRCGSTSLMKALAAHPWIVPALGKEVRFFDTHFSRGVAWYRVHFPCRAYRQICELVRGHTFLTGEATVSYIYHPDVPSRVQSTVPGVKLIAILRDPVDRAYSHYRHSVRHGFEDLSLRDALQAEAERLGQLNPSSNTITAALETYELYAY